MEGTIKFQSAKSLAEFLIAFVESTAVFSVEEDTGADGLPVFILTFTGGY